MRAAGSFHFRQERSCGFTLVEMMVVVTIMAILTVVALPNFMNLIAEQKIRSMASDIAGDLATARIEAIKQQRRVVMERTENPLEVPSTWKGGWQIYVDMDRSSTFSAGDIVLKSFGGFGGYGATHPNKVCATVGAGFNDRIIFGGDGTVVNAVVGYVDGAALTISEGDKHIRGIRISALGRTSVDVFAQGEGSVCP